MISKALPLVGLTSLILIACGPEPDVAAPPPAQAEQEIPSIAGTYRVTGFTVEKETGKQREISGTVIMSQEGDHYTSTFNLTTLFPTPDGDLQSDVIGKGEGTIEGRILRGTATTQIVMAQVPGVDAQFAFIPRFVEAGYSVILDATFLSRSRRDSIYELGNRLNVPVTILDISAPSDASDAYLAVLDYQIENEEPLDDDELVHTVTLDTTGILDVDALATSLRR